MENSAPKPGTTRHWSEGGRTSLTTTTFNSSSMAENVEFLEEEENFSFWSSDSGIESRLSINSSDEMSSENIAMLSATESESANSIVSESTNIQSR